jgi:hypothetical protein
MTEQDSTEHDKIVLESREILFFIFKNKIDIFIFFIVVP